MGGAVGIAVELEEQVGSMLVAVEQQEVVEQWLDGSRLGPLGCYAEEAARQTPELVAAAVAASWPSSCPLTVCS